jgi:hypothetical protein
LAEEVAMVTPETKIPGRRPATAVGPKKRPRMSGERMTRSPGANISRRDDLVEISMHLS